MREKRDFSIVHRLTRWAVAFSLLNATLIVLAVRPLFQNLLEVHAEQVATARAALAGASPDQRGTAAKALGTGDLHIYRVDGPPSPLEGPRCRRTAANRLFSGLDALTGADTDFSLLQRGVCGGRPSLFSSFQIDGQTWNVEFLPPRKSPRGSLWSVLAALILAATAPLVASLVGIRLIQRPMATLAREVADRGSRLRPLDLKDAAGTEFRAVFDSFNGLVNAVNSTSQTRRNQLAGVSHDLRTPLARLRLRAEVECSRDIALALEADCDALDRIIDQFVAYAQGESKVSLGTRRPLGELVRRIASAYAGRGVTVDMDDVAALQIWYPDIAILRVLTNLVDNALDHGAAPIEIRVEIGPTECRISVCDAGPGISTADAEEAFKPFVRLHSASTSASAALGHCGLGLAVVAQICREMDGRVFHRPHDGTDSAVGIVVRRHGVDTDSSDGPTTDSRA